MARLWIARRSASKKLHLTKRSVEWSLYLLFHLSVPFADRFQNLVRDCLTSVAVVGRLSVWLVDFSDLLEVTTCRTDGVPSRVTTNAKYLPAPSRWRLTSEACHHLLSPSALTQHESSKDRSKQRCWKGQIGPILHSRRLHLHDVMASNSQSTTPTVWFRKHLAYAGKNRRDRSK